jgi:ATP dependent DNA ligase C terminal region
MITAMANAGLRVGVTANSHKVIRNLLDGVRQASDELGLDLPCTQRSLNRPLTNRASGSRLRTLEPKLVAEITYLTWTADGLLRHTVYVGLREDKPPEQVRREVARG